MSERDITEFGPMQSYRGEDSKDERPVILKTIDNPQASSKIKCFLGIAGLAAFLALLITIIALTLAAASVQKGKGTPSSVAVTDTPTSNVPTRQNYCAGYAGDWTRIAYINMSDPAQQCPNAWRGYDTPIRSCGRPVTSRSICAPVYFSSNGIQYSRVCGRAVGYQKGSPDGFGSQGFDKILDGFYVDGVSMTHGNPRTHIWTFAVGLYTGENPNINNCPNEGGRQQPDFVGQNFFCGSGDHDPRINLPKFYDQDPLWNGANCPNKTGCPFNSPPWFSTSLPAPTSDDIEVRICGDQSTGDEDTPIQFLEIYVQ